jgi:hypothetical protein
MQIFSGCQVAVQVLYRSTKIRFSQIEAVRTLFLNHLGLLKFFEELLAVVKKAGDHEYVNNY